MGINNPNRSAEQMGFNRPDRVSLLPAAYRRGMRGVGADIAAAQRAQTPAQRAAGMGLVVPGSANDQHRR